MSKRGSILYTVLAAVSFALGVLLIWLLQRSSFQLDAAPNHTVYAVLFLQEVALIGLPAWLLSRRDDRHLSSFDTWWNRPSSMEVGLVSLSAVGYTLAGVLVVGLWLRLLSGLGLEVILEPSLPDPVGFLQFLFAVFSAAVVPAFCEELMFRGLMQNWIERRWGGKAALIVPSLLFALLHLSLQGFASLVVIGLLLGRLRQLSGGLWLPIAFHGIYNTSVILLNAASVQPSLNSLLLFTFVFAMSTRFLFLRLSDQSI